MGDCNCKHGTNGSKVGCTECDIPQMARNNYFTGKLLVERDFTDEQRYTMGKLRRHNQRLHGWGAVCGLKVHEHSNPGCQSQYVVIEPGTAIDCCGREILVECPEYFDFEAKFLANFQKQNGPVAQPDPKQKFKIQICVSYKECPTEDVPALFDDCSCDTNSCRPNRILESHCFDVLIVDPNAPAPDFPHPQLNWDNTLNIANVVKVAFDPVNNYLYVLTSVTSAGASTAALYAFDNKYTQIPPPFTFSNAVGLDLAIAPGGDFVYIACQPTTPATAAPQISVFAAGALASAVQQINVGTSPDNTLRLASIPGSEGSLISIGQTAGMAVWTGMNSASPAPVSTAVASVTKPVAVAVSPAGKYAYVASSGSSTLSAVALTSPPAVPATIALASVPTSLAIAPGASGDLLAALDTTVASPVLYFVTIPATGPGSASVSPHTATGFNYAPTELRLSSTGRWAYVLEEDTASSHNAYVQVVDTNAAQSGAATYLAAPVAVGIGPVDEELSQDGTHLFISYVDPTDNTIGGVSIIDISQTDCGDLFLKALEACPDCPDGDCIILATIKDYTFSNPVVDADIDNLTDRHLLVSTDLLTQVVRCLLGHDGCGPAPSSGGGTPPTPPPPVILVRVANDTWGVKGSVITAAVWNQLFVSPGLVIAFTDSVVATDLTNDTVVFLAPMLDQNTGLIAWNEVPTTVQPGMCGTVGDPTTFTSGAVGGFANAVAFFIQNQKLKEILQVSLRSKKPFHVLVKGDFIRDSTPQALPFDGDNLPPWVPNQPSGDGTPGGTFESWFTIKG